eukprot:1186565-Prorocentrum_minimum.AAC.1
MITSGGDHAARAVLELPCPQRPALRQRRCRSAVPVQAAGVFEGAKRCRRCPPGQRGQCSGQARTSSGRRHLR